MPNKAFVPYPLTHGLLVDLSLDDFPTQLYGFSRKVHILDLSPNRTHFGYVHEGQVILHCAAGVFTLRAGMYFSLPGSGTLRGEGRGIAIARVGYQGLFSIGGPIESTGRLLYIDGCRDSLLIPPVMKGDPCLNALYFPAGINQTPHTHPSMRIGIIVSGRGECITEDEVKPLEPGQVFVIPSGGLHSFRTEDSPMIVCAYHPDSDCGPTDESHPMVNRTLVNGIPARGGSHSCLVD